MSPRSRQLDSVCVYCGSSDAADPAFLAEAAALLLDDLDWSAWAEAVKAKTGAKGRMLFRPLRMALTGKEHGPEMGPLLALIGREKALKRLAGDTA